MNISDFDYVLPPHLIAQTPAEPRDSSRLLALRRNSGETEHRLFRDIGYYLKPGDLLVANNSRVFPARLHARRLPSGGKVEVLLLRRAGGDVWEALVRPAKRLRVGASLVFVPKDGRDVDALDAAPQAQVVGETPTGTRLIRFFIEEVIHSLGEMPLPPYIHHPLADPERYQTVYSNSDGSAAAPTAGLHFTPELMDQLRNKGVKVLFVTLH
ncbi:MAG: queA, partial [Dehalococcoidia bacterium]|nr:queA [Dehalococcoidia bacterium]